MSPFLQALVQIQQKKTHSLLIHSNLHAHINSVFLYVKFATV